ncbi:protein ROOT INITIATION DEFECTIVE 3-like [Pyrus ussuriensis x Pyrus communis]|uniref:Protein ROOT INITIATION DEFECTIVE 3-like n=1 Tax=Pyrus ussuriensis x Pyrus communis TaxID=2448454 RepID=A0A5N5HSN3_9ROSA|nr:protein ROOT INITIATION DEFECTIVE 3-like [Pyrus ussuriensis x Pyrus communis]KAB2629733.1 protein ROOT INITIATION DEFECTIVE 3-like [Pyrus ussuriensis x Pyrus communis]
MCSRKLRTRASQKNRSIRWLRTVKARTLLAKAHQGISTCGRLILVDCLRNGMLTTGVSCLVFRDECSLLISGSEDEGIKVWSLTR